MSFLLSLRESSIHTKYNCLWLFFLQIFIQSVGIFVDIFSNNPPKFIKNLITWTIILKNTTWKMFPSWTKNLYLLKLAKNIITNWKPTTKPIQSLITDLNFCIQLTSKEGNLYSFLTRTWCIRKGLNRVSK